MKTHLGVGLLLLLMVSTLAPANQKTRVRESGGERALYVYYYIPGLKMPKLDKGLGELELQDINAETQRVRTLGGIRLKYEYQPPFGEDIVSVKWKFNAPGWYCFEPGIDGQNQCTFKEMNTIFEQTPDFINLNCTLKKCSIWWEPSSGGETDESLWVDNLKINGDYDAITKNRKNPAVPPQNRTGKLVVESRLMGPSMSRPKGTDIEILEAVLWQLGYGPNYGLRGFKSIRIPTKQQNVFSTGCDSSLTGCTDVGSANKATMEMMVWRFKFANAIDDSDGNPQDSTVQNRDVNVAMLKNLKKHWADYIQAYSFAPGTPDFDYTDGDYQGWMETASSEWNTIYDNVLHQSIMESLGHTVDPTKEQRWEIIDAIIANESGREQWGGTRAKTPFRILQGGSDSHASPGFSQIKSRFVWGEEAGRLVSGRCSALKDVNIYKPDDAVLAVPLWTVKASCGTSFTQAFKIVGNYDSTYDNNGTYPKLVSVPSGDILDSDAFNEGSGGNYERLAKAIAAYNQGSTVGFWNEFTWPEMLKLRTKECKKAKDNVFNAQCNGLKYVISDLKTDKRRAPDAANNVINFADYTWKDQHTIDHPAPKPDETFTFCFVYGEQQWHTGVSWETVRNAAQVAAINDNNLREASCP